MSDIELKELIRNNPQSLIAQDYRLGRKEMSLELVQSMKQEFNK
jgi:hypothetical protein